MEEFFVRFWGVRGSIPAPSPSTVRYGGNTSCLEVRCGERLLIFDAGTGIRYLGNSLLKGRLDADLFLTHTHFDHVCGLPFFVPCFIPGNRLRIWAGHLGPELGIKRVLTELMMAPLFPVPVEIFQASIEFHDFAAGDDLAPGPGIGLKTFRLNHPNRAVGYRLEFQGKAICYLTDNEHRDSGPDPELVDFIRGADLVVYDSMFTEHEYRTRVGWGHSTWEAGAELCQAAGAKTYVIFHHDPDHDDEFMDKVAAQASARLPGTLVAREGMVIRL